MRGGVGQQVAGARHSTTTLSSLSPHAPGLFGRLGRGSHLVTLHPRHPPSQENSELPAWPHRRGYPELQHHEGPDRRHARGAARPAEPRALLPRLARPRDARRREPDGPLPALMRHCLGRGVGAAARRWRVGGPALPAGQVLAAGYLHDRAHDAGGRLHQEPLSAVDALAEPHHRRRGLVHRSAGAQVCGRWLRLPAGRVLRVAGHVVRGLLHQLLQLARPLLRRRRVRSPPPARLFRCRTPLL